MVEHRAQALEEQIEESERRARDDSSQASDLKIRITQRDREISELQRKIDVLEYDLKEAREETQALQDSFSQGGDSVELLETRLQQLREVIEEKEQVVEELRYEVKARDEEIERVRIGAGISELEDEKQKLLRDFYEKNREAEGLRKERDEARAQIAALEARIASLDDIHAHPSYPAVADELAALRAERDRLKADLARFPPQEKERLDKLVADLTRERDKLQVRQIELTDEKSALYGSVKKLEALGDAATRADEGLRAVESNVTMLKNYMADIEKRARAGDDPQEIVILMKDLGKVMEGDIRAAQKALAKVLKG